MEDSYAINTLIDHAPKKNHVKLAVVTMVIFKVIGAVFLIGAFLTSASGGDSAIAALIFGLFLMGIGEWIGGSYDFKALNLVFNQLDKRVKTLEEKEVPDNKQTAQDLFHLSSVGLILETEKLFALVKAKFPHIENKEKISKYLRISTPMLIDSHSGEIVLLKDADMEQFNTISEGVITLPLKEEDSSIEIDYSVGRDVKIEIYYNKNDDQQFIDILYFPSGVIQTYLALCDSRKIGPNQFGEEVLGKNSTVVRFPIYIDKILKEIGFTYEYPEPSFLQNQEIKKVLDAEWNPEKEMVPLFPWECDPLPIPRHIEYTFKSDMMEVVIWNNNSEYDEEENRIYDWPFDSYEKINSKFPHIYSQKEEAYEAIFALERN